MKQKSIIILTLLAIIVVLAACAPPPPPTLSGPVDIVLKLTYQPDVQFAPFYVGIEKGFFANHQINLTIQHIADSDVVKQVGTGEATFGVVSGEQVLMGREAGLPVVYVYDWFQQYPVAVASKAELGIDEPSELRGRSIGVPLRQGASYFGLQAILNAAGLTEADISLQETGFTQVQTLISGSVDMVVVYSNNEPIQLEALGVPVNVIPVSDVTDLISNGIITNERTVQENPALVWAMTHAFDESLRYTLDNPDEAFTIAAKYVEGLNDPAVAPAQREVLTRTLDLWHSDWLGYAEPTAWESTRDLLLQMGLLSAPPNLEAAYTNQFVPAATGQ